MILFLNLLISDIPSALMMQQANKMAFGLQKDRNFVSDPLHMTIFSRRCDQSSIGKEGKSEIRSIY